MALLGLIALLIAAIDLAASLAGLSFTSVGWSPLVFMLIGVLLFARSSPCGPPSSAAREDARREPPWHWPAGGVLERAIASLRGRGAKPHRVEHLQGRPHNGRAALRIACPRARREFAQGCLPARTSVDHPELVCR